MVKSSTTMKRLVHAKQIFLHGVDHAGRPGELNRLFSILAFDQAIEHFLNTIIYELSGSIKQKSERFFDALVKKANETLTEAGKQSLKDTRRIQDIHNLRNDAQHEGRIPSSDDLMKSKVYTEDFLRDSYSNCFSVHLDEVFLADAIEFEDVKEYCKKAEKALENSNYKETMEELAKSFLLLRSHFVQAIHPGWAIDDSFISSLSRFVGNYGDSNELVGEIQDSLSRLHDTLEMKFKHLNDRITVLSFGGNVQDYEFFRRIAPTVHMTQSRKFTVYLHDVEVSKEDCLRAFNFVYNSILSVQGLGSIRS